MKKNPTNLVIFVYLVTDECLLWSSKQTDLQNQIKNQLQGQVVSAFITFQGILMTSGFWGI